jgi:hypothetical protein
MNCIRLMEKEIRQIVIIRLRVQEGTGIPGRSFDDNTLNGDELEEPESLP